MGSIAHFFVRFIFILFPKGSRNCRWWSHFFTKTQSYRMFSHDFSWGCFETRTPKTLENIQKNVFSVALRLDWKFLCRYFSWSAQKRKDILRFSRSFRFRLFLLRCRLAKQNSLLQQKQSPTKVFPVSFVRKQSKWRHFIRVAELLSRSYKPVKRTRHKKFPEERL